MKVENTHSPRLDILGNGETSSSQEILNSILKKWRHNLGYYSVFVSVPAILASQIPLPHSVKASEPKMSITGQGAKRFAKLNLSSTTPALLKRQSKFLLPHQLNSFDPLTPFAGDDGCPGRPIPGGNYTAAAPYTDSGDTTGANDTVSRVNYYYYYSFDASGPDHVYSFTLNGRGPNPQIQVSTTSGTYKPLIYVLGQEIPGACPGGTAAALWDNVRSFSSGGTATLDSRMMSFLPLNVPLYLFVDSAHNDSSGAGSYTLRMQDVTIGPDTCGPANPVGCTEFFVRQHYQDFLNRDADSAGLAFWTNEITSCAGNTQCKDAKLVNVSAAFFLSTEFQQTGYLVYKAYAAAFGRTRTGGTVPVSRSEFLADVQRVGQGVVVLAPGWQSQLEANQVAYFNEFVQRPFFVANYPLTMTEAQYVDALNLNTGGMLSSSERIGLVADLAGGAKTRAEVLRAVVEDADFTNMEFNRAFVLMQYFGYLRRNPNDAPDSNFAGYNFWLNKLNQFNGNFVDAEMVKAFITSDEYRKRFGP